MLIRFALQPDLDTLMSTSAIPLSLYKKWKGHGDFDRDRYSELFRKYEGDKHAYRIYLPITGKPDVAKKVVVPQPIIDALAAKGYVADDYRAGIAVDNKLGKRKIKIGKLLSDNPELLKQFNHDEQRAASRVSKSDLLVVISRHPYDIAGMSTGRGWRSCTNLEDGVNKRYVIQDVKHGTLVAYLVKADDKNIEKPLARVRLYRFDRKAEKAARAKKGEKKAVAPVTADDFVLMREPRIYGTPSPQFTEVIDKWLDTVNEGRADGLYCVNKNVYTDEVHDQVELLSDTSSLIAKIQANKVPNLKDTKIRLAEDKKSAVLEAVLAKIRLLKTSNEGEYDITHCNTILNNISGLLRVCLPLNSCAAVVTELMAHKPFVQYMNNDGDVLGIDLMATAWTLGSPLAPMVKYLHEHRLELPETLKEMRYLPNDMSADELLLSFYLVTRKTLSRVWEYEGAFFYECFGNTVTIAPEIQASVKLDFVTEIADDWLQGHDFQDEYDDTWAFINRVKNLYQSFGKDMAGDKKLHRLLTQSYELNGLALFKAGLITEDGYHAKILNAVDEGNIECTEALEEYKDDPALQRKILEHMVADTDGRLDYLENKTFLDLITKEDFDKMVNASLKQGNDIDVFEMIGLLKHPKLESNRYINPQLVENNFIKRIFSYTSAADIAKLKKLVPAPPGSFLEQVYKLKAPKK